MGNLMPKLLFIMYDHVLMPKLSYFLMHHVISLHIIYLFTFPLQYFLPHCALYVVRV